MTKARKPRRYTAAAARRSPKPCHALTEERNGLRHVVIFDADCNVIATTIGVKCRKVPELLSKIRRALGNYSPSINGR